MTQKNEAIEKSQKREFDLRFAMCDFGLLIICSQFVNQFVLNARNILFIGLFYLIGVLARKYMDYEEESWDSYTTEIGIYAIIAIVLIGFGADANIVIPSILCSRLVQRFKEM